MIFGTPTSQTTCARYTSVDYSYYFVIASLSCTLANQNDSKFCAELTLRYFMTSAHVMLEKLRDSESCLRSH
jgi:hypothetical protein